MVPIVTALLPLATPLLRRLIGGAEDALGPGKGKAKMSAVMAAFKAYQDELHKEGKIPSRIQDDSILSVVIEFVLQNMRERGEISDKPKTGSGSWSFVVPAGTKITIEEGGK
jgi:hypothetical protein